MISRPPHDDDDDDDGGGGCDNDGGDASGCIMTAGRAGREVGQNWQNTTRCADQGGLSFTLAIPSYTS